MHVLVMTMLLTIVFLYSVSPLPENFVIIASLLLTVHVFLGMAQPNWYVTRELWTWKTLGPPLFMTALIWVIAVVKIQPARVNS